MALTPTLIRFVNTIQSAPTFLGELQIADSPVHPYIPLPLNDELRSYFSLLNLSGMPVLGCFFHLILFGPNDLVGALQGWRWLRSDSQEVIEELPNWNPAWVIIADRNGDVIFVDTGTDNIFGSIQGEVHLVAEDLCQFFETLTEATIIEMTKYNFEVRDATLALRPDFEAAISELVFAKLPSQAAVGFIEFFLG